MCRQCTPICMSDFNYSSTDVKKKKQKKNKKTCQVLGKLKGRVQIGLEHQAVQDIQERAVTN